MIKQKQKTGAFLLADDNKTEQIILTEVFKNIGILKMSYSANE